MANRITLDELKSYLWQSAVLLRTNIDAGAYKQYIFPLMFFKRICDVYDEETAQAVEDYGEDIDLYPEHELHKFIVPKGHHWNDVRQVTEDVGAAIVSAFREIEKANGEKMVGIFGDGAWTNKNRLPDRLLRDLLEHFSSRNLSLENCPEDELGQGYEYLIKKFADDSGHTAQEFYTNRTVVHLMTEMLQPQSGESVYDPTCGSAGMLISCIAYLKDQGKEWRNLQVYGQEINQLTSAIGRMNLFLHGIEDFHVVNDDTLKNPAFIERGQLKQFDLVLANPPYWDEGMGKSSASPLAERARRGRGALELFCQATRRLLVARGHGYFIYPATQTARLVQAAAQAGLGLRRLLFVRARSGQPAMRVLAEARKDCASDTLVLPDLVLYGACGQSGQAYSADAKHFCPWLE